ncbi:MAG: hypothetical protein V1748_00595 [Actinomycetota bacterium]
MRPRTASIFSLLLTLGGLALIGMGVSSGRLGSDSAHFLVFATLVGISLVLAVSGLAARRGADDDYKKVLGTGAFLTCSGLAALAIFFGTMSAMLSRYAWGVLLAVMLLLYGTAMIMAAAANFILSQRDYRVFAFDLFRQVPWVYYRYRT